MNSMRCYRACLLAALGGMLGSPAIAEEKEFRGQDVRRIAAWLRVSQQHASDYRIYPRERPEAAFKLLPKPVFKNH